MMNFLAITNPFMPNILSRKKNTRIFKEKTRLIESDELSRTALPTHADWLIISGLPFKRASRKSGIKIEPNILYKN